MTKYTINTRVSTYENKGQRAEQDFILDYFGVNKKADNISHTVQADFANMQIKAFHGEIMRNCTSIYDYLENDKADTFVYVFQSYTAYIMDKSEYIRFVSKFASAPEYRPDKGITQVRFKRCEQKMEKWLCSQM